MTEIFLQAFIYLMAAVVMVPLAKKFALGSVLGYLIAGVIIGPIIGLVGEETVTIQHFAEFGVVMMLFLVGLELEPKMLWAMRNRLMGLGGFQLSITTIIIMAIGLLCGLHFKTALSIGLILALSSTAIVLQTLGEKGLMKTEGGKNSFSILLFQDIAVIPMIALLPLLALPEFTAENLSNLNDNDSSIQLSLFAELPNWAYGLVVIASISFVVASGHFLAAPMFRYVANSGLKEIFTATALMLVIGISALMSWVGLSPALGAFLAGVVLANSEFRHELESNIDPFKGLLLGLFFITVGAGINVEKLMNDWVFITGLTLAVMFIKFAVLLCASFLFKIKGRDRWLFSLGLAQAGEFGFVLLGYASHNHVLNQQLTQDLSLVVAFSMFLTPGLFIVFDRFISPRFQIHKKERENDLIEETGSVIIAGVGRFGQVVNRLLVSNGIKTILLDYRVSQIDLMKRIGTKAYFGDASQPQVLNTAGLTHASAVVVAIDHQENSIKIVEYIKATHPHIKVLARAFDRGHSFLLRQAGADYVEHETYLSALEIGGCTMKALGLHPFYIEQQKARYKRIEIQKSNTLYQAWLDGSDNIRFDNNYRRLFMMLEDMLAQEMKKDRYNKLARNERGWTPPPKGYDDDIENENKHEHETMQPTVQTDMQKEQPKQKPVKNKRTKNKKANDK